MALQNWRNATELNYFSVNRPKLAAIKPITWKLGHTQLTSLKPAAIKHLVVLLKTLTSVGYFAFIAKLSIIT